MTEEKKDIEYSPEMQEFLIARFLLFNKINLKVNQVRLLKSQSDQMNTDPVVSFGSKSKYYEILITLMDDITIFVENYMMPEELMSIAVLDIFKHCGIEDGLFDTVQFGMLKNG